MNVTEISKPEPKSAFFVSLDGRDFIEMRLNSLGEKEVHFVGCEALAELIRNLRSLQGPNPAQWSLPAGTGHESLLLKEFILKSQGKWQAIYKHDELCHCRFVQTSTVEQAILAGAHTPEMVSRWTSASTACGTCRPDVQAILNERLKVS